MISKNRSIPLIMQKEEALLRRLPTHHPQYPAVADSLAKRRAGYKGEQAIDYYLKQLDYDKFHIFHDLRLRSESIFFQIDTLLLTSHYLLIIEVKNITGTVFFDTDFNQMIRTAHDKEEGFRSPLVQAASQRNHLTDFLETHRFNNLPIEYVITFSYSSTIIKSNTPDIAKFVIHAEDLPEKIEKLTKKHAEKELARREIQRLKKVLLTGDIPLDPNVLQKYQISPSAILSGVYCPNCNFLPMHRDNRKWYCPACHTRSSSAHEQAINDYLLLISPTISSKECRVFLHHFSKTTVKRYFLNMGLKKMGNGKNTVYQR